MATTVPATGMLGRYQVLRPLAKGGMAEVLLARALGLAGFARYVVIKRIRVENISDQKAIDMFLDEARLVASLHHRNIVQVHDVGEEDGKYFFVMEYVHGRDTRELLRKIKEEKQQLPLEHVISIASAAAAGLHYAHERRGPDRMPLGIVHRDISPGNILVAFDGGVKVVDFGIAKAHARAIDTQAGERKGKVGYMSPEQCRAEPVDRRTDVFQLGIVLWELCTVKRLFNKEGRFETMKLIADGEIPLPSRFRPDLPSELEEIVMKALAKDPGDRYQTADELRIALESFAARAGLTLSAGRLSDYLKQLFGDVPEPWLAEDLPPPDPAVLERVRTSGRFSVPTIPPELLASVTEPQPPASSSTSTETATPSATDGAASQTDTETAATAAEHAATHRSDNGPSAPSETEPQRVPTVATTSEGAASAAVAGEIAAANTDAGATAATMATAVELPGHAAGPADTATVATPTSRASEPEPASTRAAKPSAAGAPTTSAMPRHRDTPVSWPVDPSSVRARRRWLITLGLLAAAAAAFLIAAFTGPDVEPTASSTSSMPSTSSPPSTPVATPPVATPPIADDASPGTPAAELGEPHSNTIEPATTDAAVPAAEPATDGASPPTLDAGIASEGTAPDASPSAEEPSKAEKPDRSTPKPKPTRRPRSSRKSTAKPAASAEPAESAEPATAPTTDLPAPAPAPSTESELERP